MKPRSEIGRSSSLSGHAALVHRLSSACERFKYVAGLRNESGGLGVKFLEHDGLPLKAGSRWDIVRGYSQTVYEGTLINVNAEYGRGEGAAPRPRTRAGGVVAGSRKRGMSARKIAQGNRIRAGRPRAATVRGRSSVPGRGRPASYEGGRHAGPRYERG